MPEEQLNHLIKMVNQIALNLSAAGDEDEAAYQTSEHIKKFWSPLMKQQIKGCIDSHETQLVPIAYKAVTTLEAP